MFFGRINGKSQVSSRPLARPAPDLENSINIKHGPRHARIRVTLIAIAFGLACTLGSQTISQSPHAWTRAIIIVFERRVPLRMSHDANAGVRLRELREEVVHQLEKLPLRVGDHLFVFADGISQAEFDCMVHGTSCGLAPPGTKLLAWNSGVSAAREFLTSMLRLPERPNSSQSDRMLGVHGEQFLHLVYRGEIKKLDCAIRRELTAPMTVAYDVSSPCPLETDEIDRLQTRAVSRVEMSIAIQVNAALNAVKSSLVTETIWLWALLGEKNYKREDTSNGIRQDFQQQSASVVDFFEQAYRAYPVQPEGLPVRLEGGQMLSLYSISSRSTQDLLKLSSDAADVTEVMVGDLKKVRLNTDLVITTGFLGGPWKPDIDEFTFSARLQDRATGQLLSARMEVATGGNSEVVPPATSASGLVQLKPTRASQVYRDALRSHFWKSGVSFDCRMDLLVAGSGSPSPYEFTPIPAIYELHRNIRAERPIAGTREIIAIVLVTALLALGTFSVLRPQPFEVSLTPNKFRWTYPSKEKSVTIVAKVAGYTHPIHRRWFSGPTRTTIRWKFFPPTNLPVKPGSEPVQVLMHNPVPSGTWHSESGTWRPGRRSVPSTIQELSVQLSPSAFDSSMIHHPQSLAGCFQFDVKVRPRLRLPLQPYSNTFWVLADIEIAAERPQPTLTVQIAGAYRRLGFACAEGGAFGNVAVENIPHNNGVARDVEVRLTIEIGASPHCRIVFDAPGKPQTYVCILKSGIRSSVDLALIPNGTSVGAEPQDVSGVITADVLDTVSGERYDPIRRFWKVTWLPAAARIAGLDLGTSGVRLFVENPALRYEDLRMSFPMSNVNAGDNEDLPEFPSLVRMNGDRGVVGVGARPHGIYAEGGGKVVESPKAALLAVIGGAEEGEARSDFEQYVSALGRSWAAIRSREKIEYARFVLTIPWTYTREIASWYCELVQKHFDGVATITTVREAEAAAYFHLLRHRFVFDPNSDESFPRNREHRTLVVDAGAGTIDFAVIAAKAPEGEIREFSMLAWAFSHCAGDRYDEEMLTHVFDRDDAKQLVLEDMDLRNRLRTYKESRLPGLLTGHGRDPLYVKGTGVMPRITSSEVFLSSMSGWFQEAITGPIQKLIRDLGKGKPTIDEVLLAGRGVLAFGCRERIETDVRRFFSPVPGIDRIPTRSFPPQDLPAAIAKGALSFARKVVRIGDSDLVATRDIILVIELPDRAQKRELLSAGDARRKDSFGPYASSLDIRQAWVLGGEPVLSDKLIRRAVGRLRTGTAPEPGVKVLATWNAREGVRRLEVRIDPDERVSFVEPASKATGGFA